MFFERSASRLVTSISFSASSVSVVSGTSWTWNSPSVPSSSGFDVYPAFSRLRSVNASRLTISIPPFGRSRMLVRSAAGFIATSTFGSSPGVRMSWSEKWIWKPETPGSEPAGARISAGKSGSVDRSFPRIAVSLVKRSPVSCMPSPESPANRITTWSSCSTGLALIPRSAGIAPGLAGGGLGDQFGEARVFSDRVQVAVGAGQLDHLLVGSDRRAQVFDRVVGAPEQRFVARDVEEDSGLPRKLSFEQRPVELDRALVVLGAVRVERGGELLGQRKERLPGLAANREHGCPGLLGNGAALSRGVANEDERSSRRVDLLVIHGERRPAGDDDVQLLLSGQADPEPGLVVLIDDLPALDRAVGAGAE